MFSMRHTIIVLITSMAVLTWKVDGAITPERQQLSFNYTNAQLSMIAKLPIPKEQITVDQLSKISEEVSYLIDSANLNGVDQNTLPAYLAEAQKEFAWLSYLLSGKFSGNLGPITNWVLQLFIPNASLASVNKSDYDVYTSSISSVVMEQIVRRLDKERQGLHNYPIKHGEEKWTPTSPGYIGLDFGSIRTWSLTSSDQFLADVPPSNKAFWMDECLKICDAQDVRTPAESEAVFRWAGLTGLGSGDWHYIATNQLEEQNASIADRLYVRAVLFCALVDSCASAFNSKYTYWIKRPSQNMDRVKPLITIPNHPSYPSAHSTVGATAAVVLTHFFPRDEKKWNQLAEESGMSRIWGGIHYPLDHTNGVALGKKIGYQALRNLNKPTN
ncbi:MAG: vanadium-dependent haloperoxidase [Chlamydiota bacterium]|nr:vanadium-dependent haloperoxidase [Chlamydiota bacterium]